MARSAERSPREHHDRPRFVAGTMTGTSIDGDLDAALVEVHGHGLEMRASIVATGSWALGDVAADLRADVLQFPEFGRCHGLDFARK